MKLFVEPDVTVIKIWSEEIATGGGMGWEDGSGGGGDEEVD